MGAALACWPSATSDAPEGGRPATEGPLMALKQKLQLAARSALSRMQTLQCTGQCTLASQQQQRYHLSLAREGDRLQASKCLALAIRRHSSHQQCNPLSPLPCLPCDGCTTSCAKLSAAAAAAAITWGVRPVFWGAILQRGQGPGHRFVLIGRQSAVQNFKIYTIGQTTLLAYF